MNYTKSRHLLNSEKIIVAAMTCCAPLVYLLEHYV